MKYIKNLIAINSISGNEQSIQEYISEEIKKMGQSAFYVGKNVVVKIKGKNSTKALIFNAHVDTVPAGNNELWESNPFVPIIRNVKLYGLGASDEKAGVASLLGLANKYTQVTPACDVWFHFVVSEEIDGSGTKETMQWFMKKCKSKYTEIAGILVEPTGLEEIQIGHKGNIFLKLTSFGDSGHGSCPEQIKKHAVFVMFQAFQKLKELEAHWKKYADNELGMPSIALATSIQAGDMNAPNKFPDTCTATIDVRTVPTMHTRALLDISRTVQGYGVSVVALYPPASFGKTNITDTLVVVAKKVLPKALVCTSPGSTDQCFFTERNIPAIILGPGEKRCMHIPNEYCIPEKIEKACAQYSGIVEEWGK